MPNVIHADDYWHIGGEGNCGMVTIEEAPDRKVYRSRSFKDLSDRIDASMVERCPDCDWPRE